MKPNNRDVARRMVKRLQRGVEHWSKPVTEMTDYELIFTLRAQGVQGKLTNERLERIARGMVDE